jgi:hypothetical protein
MLRTPSGRDLGSYFRLPVGILLTCLEPPFALAAEPQVDPVISRGLTHTLDGQNEILRAIRRANEILHAARLGLKPLSYTAAGTVTSIDAIAVYLIATPASAISTAAAVPRGCTCIFANSALLASWVRTHSQGTGRMALDGSILMTFMLLHEVGHLIKGGASGEFSDGGFSQLNLEPTHAKANEEDADAFAANLIREQAQPGVSIDAFLAANETSRELTKLGWNMQAYRSLGQFGSGETGKPSVYFDQTYTHPNLAWRMLRSNDLIQHTTASRRLLDAFEEARQRGASLKKLYP